MTIKVELPGVHMSGSDAHHNAHLEVGQHGFALFLAPNAEYPVLDVNGSLEQLEAVVRDLQAALVATRASSTDSRDRAETNPIHPVPAAASPA